MGGCGWFVKFEGSWLGLLSSGGWWVGGGMGGSASLVVGCGWWRLVEVGGGCVGG